MKQLNTNCLATFSSSRKPSRDLMPCGKSSQPALKGHPSLMSADATGLFSKWWPITGSLLRSL